MWRHIPSFIVPTQYFPLFFLDHGVRIDTQQRYSAVIEKVRRGQTRSVTTDTNEQVDIRKMLPVQFGTIDTRKVHMMVPQDLQQAVHTLLVRLEPRLEPLPTQGLWCLAP